MEHPISTLALHHSPLPKSTVGKTSRRILKEEGA